MYVYMLVYIKMTGITAGYKERLGIGEYVHSYVQLPMGPQLHTNKCWQPKANGNGLLTTVYVITI